MHPLSFLVHEESRRYIIFTKIQLKSVDFALKTADFWWFKQNIFIKNCPPKCRIWISQAQRTVFFLFLFLFFSFLFFLYLLIACSKSSPKVFTKLHDTSCKIPNFSSFWEVHVPLTHPPVRASTQLALTRHQVLLHVEDGSTPLLTRSNILLAYVPGPGIIENKIVYSSRYFLTAYVCLIYSALPLWLLQFGVLLMVLLWHYAASPCSVAPVTVASVYPQRYSN